MTEICQAIKKNGNQCTAETWNGIHCCTHANQLRRQEFNIALKEGRAKQVTEGFTTRWVITPVVDGTPGPTRLSNMFPMESK